MSITEFYKNKELFITGGTGFLGKSLIEKLLRSCPDISKIYLFIREKRNKTPRERLQELSNDLLFERLHREQPKAFEKIIPIVGDSLKLGLGISSEDLERLKNVHIIIHGAADVRFNTDLHDSILSNIRGTYELLKLALNFKHLIAFVHVSTAYVNPFSSKLCEAPVDWLMAIKIAETFEAETLECLKMKFSQFPNSYSLTKNLSEQVVAEFANNLPITILRPSIVVQSLKEPEPGYIDNLNGPMAGLVAIAVGLAQVTYCNKDLVISVIPVDTTTILTIIAAYKRGLQTINSKTNGLDIRNLTLGKLYKLTLGKSSLIFLNTLHEEPFEETLWAPSQYMTTNFYLFILSIFFINIPMALIYDTLLMLSKKQRRVMQLTRKLVNTSKVIQKFSHTFFEFQNDGMYDLIESIPAKEREIFNLDYIANGIDTDEAIIHLRSGVKKYVFKQPQKATLTAKRRYKMFIIFDEIFKGFLFIMFIILLWKLVH